MKNENLMLSIIFLDEKHMSKIDVYLQPFIDELKSLWEWILIYDVSRFKTHPARELFYVVWHMCVHHG